MLLVPPCCWGNSGGAGAKLGGGAVMGWFPAAIAAIRLAIAVAATCGNPMMGFGAPSPEGGGGGGGGAFSSAIAMGSSRWLKNQRDVVCGRGMCAYTCEKVTCSSVLVTQKRVTSGFPENF